MSWLDSFDPQTVAQQLAQSSVYAQQSQLAQQQGKVSAGQKALTSLKSALTTFRSALKGFAVSGSQGGMVKNSATASRDGFMTLTPGAAAKKGLYQLKVVATASTDQKAFESMTDADVSSASGSLKVAVAGKEMSIDMAGVDSLAALRDKINAESGEVAVTASLVRQNGKNVLMLNSDKTGKANAVTLAASDGAFSDALSQATQISSARDAEIHMGESEDKPMVFHSAGNTFKDVIPGVELTVVQPSGDDPLIINVDNDESATKAQMTAFVDAWNTLNKSLATLTRSGDSDGTVSRGVLAGDSGIAGLKNKLNTLLRSDFNGAKLSQFGISANREGELELDSKKFEEALKTNPQALNSLFDGPKGLLKRLEKEGLDGFLNTSNGSIKQRQETLDRRSEQLKRKETQIQTRFDTSFQRYLKEFSNMKTIISQMNQTMGMFF